MRTLKRAIRVQFPALLLLVVFLSAACGRSPTGPTALPGATVAVNSPPPLPTATAVATAVPPTPTSAPRPVRVVKTAPVANVVSNEEYDFSNCGGSIALSQPFSDIVQVSAEVVISESATRSDGTVAVIDEGRRVELAQEVELAYEPELTAARTVVQQTRMEAAPFTRWGLLIVWEDRVYAAAVSFPGDGLTPGVAALTATAAYTYTQHVPSIGYYKTMPCTA